MIVEVMVMKVVVIVAMPVAMPNFVATVLGIATWTTVPNAWAESAG